MRIDATPKFTEENKSVLEKKGSTFFAGNLKQENKIEQKKKQMQEDAKKMLQDVFEKEKEIDTDLADRQDRIGSLREQIKGIDEEFAAMEEAKSKEDPNIEKTLGDQVEEAKKRQELETNKYKLEKEIEVEAAVIRGVSIERLKYHPMVDAQKSVDELEKATSKEIQGLILEDAKETIEETQKEEEEKAQKAAQKAEEEKGQEVDTQKAVADELVKIDGIKGEIEKEMKELEDKIKELEEMKGIAVDQRI